MISLDLKIYKSIKRLIDLGLVSVSMLIFAPVLLVVSLTILLVDRQCPFFKQTRVGYRGQEFNMYKFRTMRLKPNVVLNNTRGTDKCFKDKTDPRITSLGRILRKFSLDELPQLINVFMGHMSIVGPRPPLPAEVARYTYKERIRLWAQPGLVCFWQIMGRSDLSFEKQVELDTLYLRERSILTDFAIIARAVPAVVMGRGAY